MFYKLPFSQFLVVHSRHLISVCPMSGWIRGYVNASPVGLSEERGGKLHPGLVSRGTDEDPEAHGGEVALTRPYRAL